MTEQVYRYTVVVTKEKYDDDEELYIAVVPGLALEEEAINDLTETIEESVEIAKVVIKAHLQTFVSYGYTPPVENDEPPEEPDEVSREVVTITHKELEISCGQRYPYRSAREINDTLVIRLKRDHETC